MLPNRVQFFESHFQKEFNSLSHIQPKSSIFFGSYRKKFSSLSRKKSSITWVILKKSWVLEVIRKKFNSMIHIQKKKNFLSHIQSTISLSPIKEGVQFLESYYEKTDSILRVIVKKGWNSSSNVQKKVPFFFESYFLKKKVLSVIFWKIFESYPKKINSKSRVQKKKSWILWVH